MNIIFAYLTSLCYDRIMHINDAEGNNGYDVIKEQTWITPKAFLKALNWGSDDKGKTTKYSINVIREAFITFMQDGVFETRGEYPVLEFKFLQELDYPSDEQITEAQASNKYFMMAADDLIDSLNESLISGRPQLSRNRSSLLPLFEALETDPLNQVYRNEMIYQTVENFPEIPEERIIRIVQIGVGTGSSTTQLVKELVNHYEDVRIELFCFEDVANQLKRARERVQGFDRELKNEYQEKGISIYYQFKTLKYTTPINLEENSVDLILSFQNLQFLSHDERFVYYERLAKLLNEAGKIIISQLTSYSDTFPHPMSLMMLAVKEFQNYPTVEQMKEYAKTYFKSHRSSGLDTFWILSKPRFV